MTQACGSAPEPTDESERQAESWRTWLGLGRREVVPIVTAEVNATTDGSGNYWHFGETTVGETTAEQMTFSAERIIFPGQCSDERVCAFSVGPRDTTGATFKVAFLLEMRRRDGGSWERFTFMGSTGLPESDVCAPGERLTRVQINSNDVSVGYMDSHLNDECGMIIPQPAAVDVEYSVLVYPTLDGWGGLDGSYSYLVGMATGTPPGAPSIY